MKKDKTPQISTASLPDIVFLLLFFFMVSSVMRQNEEVLRTREPAAREISKIDKKILIKELNIGFDESGNSKIHAGSKFLTMDQVIQWVHESRNDLPEHLQDQMIVMIRADKDVEMGLISDIGEQLRKSNARKVLYRTLEK